MASAVSEDRRRTVIRRELAWHEQESETRRRRRADDILYRRPAFAAVVQAAFDFLRLQPGQFALDIGCGVGAQAALLAEQGQRVVAVDLSLAHVQAARRLLRHRAPQAEAFFVQASAEELPFAAGAFPVIYGKAVLHHLDLALSAQEVRRILRPGGRASFAEPLAGHPLFRLGRWLTPGLRTRDEHPIQVAELRQFGQGFRVQASEPFFFLAPLAYALRVLPGGEGLFLVAHRLLITVDRALLTRFPWLRRWAWYCVLNLER